jgi:hypothetical protein
MAKKPDINLSSQDIADAKERLKARQLNDGDFELLIKILDFVVTLRSLLETRRFNVLMLLRRMFGMTTETKNGSARKKIGDNPKSGNTTNQTKGRKGKDDYPGAKKVEVKHDHLCVGDACPECHKGKLKSVEPSPVYKWTGEAPLQLTIFLLERLQCPICKTTFTAKAPAEADGKTVDDSNDDHKVARCDGNASANAMVAAMRYQYGVPNYRLAKIQSQAGIGLPESTQFRMIAQVAASAIPVFEFMVKFAASGRLLMNDDTRMKILDLIKIDSEPPENGRKKAKRRSTRTSTLVAIVGEREVVLYFTGTAQAGENLATVLDQRDPSLEPPIQMCDGLAANSPGKDYLIEVANCLTHARRGFFALYNAGMTSLEIILDEFGLIYKNDSNVKIKGLTDQERLRYHQVHSKGPINRIEQWMKMQLEEKIVEPNSKLGIHIRYCQERWPELTLFLRKPGVPLSNDETERRIKSVARHRKNSLFYKTENGAYTGDVIMSLIETCNVNDVPVLPYLVALQENRSQVLKAPEKWLPWKYLENLSG